MNNIRKHTGERIRQYRHSRNLTLQQLANSIHKSRSTVSKYETGDLALDIETLAEIADILQVSPNQLLDYQPPHKEPLPDTTTGISPFYQARRLYFYFFDGRYQRLKDGIIDITENQNRPGHYEATLSISTISASGRSSEMYYSGAVIYSDMLIRFEFNNHFNALEKDLLYIFNPLEMCEETSGLLCGISSADLRPCAFKCLVTLTPQEQTDALKNRLLLTREDLKRCKDLNMLLVDNL